jgi:hypothetical protein
MDVVDISRIENNHVYFLQKGHIVVGLMALIRLIPTSASSPNNSALTYKENG